MKQSLARSLLIISLIFSFTSFAFSLLALNYQRWKSVSLRSDFQPLIIIDQHPLDPLIRGEVEKYIEVLYQRGDIHLFGLSTHCLNSGQCGMNYLPSFDELHYGLCHSIQAHYQCIFSPNLLTSHDGKCRCERPSYVRLIEKLLWISIGLQLTLFIVNLFRLFRTHCSQTCNNDIQHRSICLVCSLFSFLCMMIILIQIRNHKLDEVLEYFDSMRRHYSRIQIYTFSKDLDVILEQIEHSLEVKMGGSYFYILFSFVLILICFILSTFIEIKVDKKCSSFSGEEIEDEKFPTIVSSFPGTFVESNTNHRERFVPSEQIRYTRQTKV